MRYTIVKSTNKCFLCIMVIFFIMSSSFFLKIYLQKQKAKGEWDIVNSSFVYTNAALPLECLLW